MTTLSRVLGWAFLATVIVCLATVLTGGHPEVLISELRDLYHRFTA